MKRPYRETEMGAVSKTVVYRVGSIRRAKV